MACATRQTTFHCPLALLPSFPLLLPPLEGTVSLPRAKMLAKREGTMRGKAAQAGAWELDIGKEDTASAP